MEVEDLLQASSLLLSLRSRTSQATGINGRTLNTNVLLLYTGSHTVQGDLGFRRKYPFYSAQQYALMTARTFSRSSGESNTWA